VSSTYVAVIGASEASDTELAYAIRVGMLLAQADAILISGGMEGVMRASCQAAVENGGVTVGLLPGRDRRDGNEFLTVALPTGMGELRNGLVVGAADAVIAIGGGWGTLSEIALAMRGKRPLVALHSWDVTPPGEIDQHIVRVESPEEAVEVALTLIASRPM
jgi:uncharacterized protein (TIGR00725 family)